jgi:hypothetical protein
MDNPMLVGGLIISLVFWSSLLAMVGVVCWKKYWRTVEKAQRSQNQVKLRQGWLREVQQRKKGATLCPFSKRRVVMTDDCLDDAFCEKCEWRTGVPHKGNAHER